MKKLNLFLWFIALVGLITSCSRDEAVGPQNEASNRVRIGTSIDQALQTRAASVTIPANHKLRYVLEVWSTGANAALVHRNELTATNEQAVAFDFLLTEAGNYKALLWADFVPESETGTEVTTPNKYTHFADHHYVTNSADGLKAVALAKTGADYVINDDARDAFFACLPIEKGTGAFADNVELTRPFGQINVIEKNTNLLGKVGTMTLAYDVPVQFNVETGATGALIDVKPALSTLPTATADRKANLFYDFIFAPATGQTTLGEIALKFESNDAHVTLPDYTIPANMPVVRNKRTNISGSILQANSNDVTLTVAVSDGWTTPDNKQDVDIPVARAIIDACKTAGSGNTASDYTYTIKTAGQLAALATLTNAAAEITGSTAYYRDANYLLANGIDLENKPWTPIGNSTNNFKGTFDGGGYSISGLNVDNGNKNYAGLFGYIRDGSVRNLRVIGNVTTTGNDAGGIVGFFSSSGIIENCIFSGEVSGKQYAGGIAGYCYGNYRIAGCHTKGRVTAATINAGGITGTNSNNCTLTDCYSEAEVTAGSYAGGIAGTNFGPITRCYATGKVSGQEYVGGILGYEMKSTSACIALNPDLTKTGGDKTTFGRIVGLNSGGTVDNCGAFDKMRFMDATTTRPFDNHIGIDGTALTGIDGVTKSIYTLDYSFPEATATTPGWAFDSKTTWEYLPWNPAFETFSGIQPADYCISVPYHITSTL